jgi:hypothetical protein
MRRRTIDEEEVRGGILLLSAGEIADDAVDVGGGGHEHVDRVEARLWLSVARYGFNDFWLDIKQRRRWSRQARIAHESHFPLGCQTA